jgi:hypothetical protein
MLKKAHQRHSRIAQKLNVSKRTPHFFARSALLDGLFEHPARGFSVVLDVRTIEFPPCHNSFSQPAKDSGSRATRLMQSFSQSVGVVSPLRSRILRPFSP